jgi:hypothetical protein
MNLAYALMYSIWCHASLTLSRWQAGASAPVGLHGVSASIAVIHFILWHE